MNNIRTKFITLIFTGIITSGYAQEKLPENSTYYKAEIFGSAATGDNTPFWITSNQYGVVPLNSNNGYGRVGIFHNQWFGKGFRWGAGLDVIATVPRHKNFHIQQIYASLGYKCLEMTLGSKEQYESRMGHPLIVTYQ